MEYFLDAYGVQNFVWAVFTLSLIILGLGLALSILYRHTVYYGVMALGGVVEKGVLKVAGRVKTKWKEKKNKQDAGEETMVEENPPQSDDADQE